jgi:hypothetical protein
VWLIFMAKYDWTTGPGTKHRLALGAGAFLVAVGTGVAVWFVGSSGGDSARPADDPVVFLRGVVTKIAANDYGAVWQTLHPAQQRIATRDAYVQCEQLSPIPGHLDSIRLVKAATERIAIAGDDGQVESEAATFRVRISEPVLNDAVVVPMTVHAVAVKGQWRWILSPKRFELYRSKSCVGSTSPGAVTGA